MNQKIIFQINKKEKEELRTIAQNEGLTLASFCRFILLKKLKENRGDNDSTKP